MTRRTVLTTIVGVAFAFVMFPASVGAVDFPCRTAKVIVPWKPGGETDVVSRLFVESANKSGATPQLQVVNIPGQGGNKGAKEARAAKPDGCTLFFIHESAMTSNLTGRVDFNHAAFEPVALLTRTWSIIGANKNVPYDNLKDLAAHAEKNPNQILAGATLGSTSQFAILLFQDEANVKFKYVSYEGTRERMTALLAHNIDIGQISTTAAKKYITSGELKALGVQAPKRLSVISGVPTTHDLGFESEWATSRGVVAPKGTPKAVVDHYIDVFRKASKDPRVQKQMEAKGTDIVFMAGAEYGRFMDQNFARLKKLAIDIGMYKGK